MIDHPDRELSDSFFMENVIIQAVAQKRIKLIQTLMELYLETQKQEDNQ